MKQHGLDTWSSRFMTSLWNDSNRSWDSNGEDWRIVGFNHFSKLSEESSDSGSDPNCKLYIVEFPSKRLGAAYTSCSEIKLNTHVIVEADRGIDCGVVKGYTTHELYKELLRKFRGDEDKLRLKKIYKEASESDINALGELRSRMDEALAQCRNYVSMKGLRMEILDCEYQFDLNKITFFYRSEGRVDFRDLVKDLYKVFKTRIWMWSVDKTCDKALGQILRTTV